MPIGKDSITKRVAKITTETATPEVEKTEVVNNAVVNNAVSDKLAPTAVVKTDDTKKEIVVANSSKTSTCKKKAKAENTVTSAVVSNIDPEIVEKMLGNNENKEENFDKVSVGDEMPEFLL